MNMHVSLTAECSQVNDQRWTATLKEREATKQIFDQFQVHVWNPLAEQLERVSPRPDLFFEIQAASGEVGRYLVPANDLHAWDDHWSRLFRTKAAAVRKAWLAHRSTCERLGWDAACDESERLCSKQCELESRLVLMPAPDEAALMWKLEHLFGSPARSDKDHCDSWCAEWMNQIMSDARRLLGGVEDLFAVNGLRAASGCGA